jgi:DUF4097 and DUF4098 domain-containing protein YvlB
MKVLLAPALIFAVASLLVAAPQHHSGARYAYSGHHNFSNNDPNSDACEDHMNISSDEFRSQARAEEEKVVSKQPLKITASRNGGIHVKQWDRNEIGIKICKVAVARTDAEAQHMVNAISLSINGNDVRVNGPNNQGDEDGNWSSVVLVRVPAGAQLDLSAYNGGVSFRKVNVNATAHTVNGGISLNETSGKLDVQAQNGGVTVEDCNGDIKVDVQNGGVSLKLAPTWKGTGLEARTHNGGLVVEVPRDFKSALEVSGSRHTAILCQDDACSRGQRTWNDDDARILRIGAGDPVIRTSTVNGGIVVKNRTRGDDDTI